MNEELEINRNTKYPISYQVIEAFSKPHSGVQTDYIYIGNTGGVFRLKLGSDHFKQDFTPDSAWEAPDDHDLRRQYAVLYPAVLYKFLQWQDGLDDDDKRKQVDLVKGSSNGTMSNFRSKLLGDSYKHERRNNKQNPNKDIYDYELDLSGLRGDKRIMKKLKRYYKRAKKNHYETSKEMPKEGQMDLLQVDV